MADLFLQVGKQLRVAEAKRYAPFGLTPAQGRLLGVLADSTRQLCMGDVAAILGVVPRAVTPQVDALEQAGLVRRRTDPHNRRAILLDLTDAGAEVRRALVNQRRAAAAELFAPLSPRQRTAMLNALEAIASAHRPHSTLGSSSPDYNDGPCPNPAAPT
jgi:DNA-binding MarR family transcriptional regulator